MELRATETIAAGLEATFLAATDTEAIRERLARKGVDPRRTDGGEALGAGAAWRAEARWNGRRYPLALHIEGWKPPESLRLVLRSGGITGDLVSVFEAVSPAVTRLRMTLALRGAGIRDKMLIKSATLGKGGLERRFGEAIEAYARSIEARAGRGAG